jgi:hypothetical protein
MMVNSALAPHHPSRKQAFDNFRGNLQEIVSIEEHHRIPVILGTVVSNLRDWRPFDSALPPDSLDAAQWQQLLDDGKRALEQNRLDEAERSTRRHFGFSRIMPRLTSIWGMSTSPWDNETELSCPSREYETWISCRSEPLQG